MALACATYGSGVDPCATRLGKRRLAGLTLKRLRQISCECRGCRGYFAVGAWYVFVRISFCRVFEISTQELHYGEESKEKESEEEEVILRLGVALQVRRMRLAVGDIQPPFACLAAFRLRDMHFDGHSGLFTRFGFGPDPPDFRFVLAADNPRPAADGSAVRHAYLRSSRPRHPCHKLPSLSRGRETLWWNWRA